MPRLPPTGTVCTSIKLNTCGKCSVGADLSTFSQDLVQFSTALFQFNPVLVQINNEFIAVAFVTI